MLRGMQVEVGFHTMWGSSPIPPPVDWAFNRKRSGPSAGQPDSLGLGAASRFGTEGIRHRAGCGIELGVGLVIESPEVARRGVGRADASKHTLEGIGAP